jgi:multiple sugar transport system ATP-binding protein
MADVELRDVHKRFGRTEVVRGVDLSVRDGEFVVLVGPSGCGKSTLLRMIAGLEDISGGEILIGGQLVNNLEPRERDIAMVFQSYALYPHMTVERNLGFSMRLRRLAAETIRGAVDTAASTLALAPFLDRRPQALSGGQRQRVAMGRAIVRHPKAFLFDEPLSNLDAQLRVQMRTEIRRLHQRLGATSIYVTHDQVEAMTMADRIIVLDRGQIAQCGTPLELYDRPASRFVASFIGSPSINLLRSEIVDGRLRLPSSRGGIGLEMPGIRALGKVDAGIRPEHFIRVAEGGIAGTVQVVEYLGAETYVVVEVGGREVRWRTPGREAVGVGEPLLLGFDPANLHLFDTESGVRL